MISASLLSHSDDLLRVKVRVVVIISNLVTRLLTLGVAVLGRGDAAVFLKLILHWLRRRLDLVVTVLFVWGRPLPRQFTVVARVLVQQLAARSLPLVGQFLALVQSWLRLLCQTPVDFFAPRRLRLA